MKQKQSLPTDIFTLRCTGESSFSTASLFAFFAEGCFVDDPFNLRFCANDS